MNLNPLPWLRGCLVRSEIATWVNAGIIQTDQQQRICQQYDAQCCGLTTRDCARLTLFGLSAMSMILALVLITTEHWRGIHLLFKLGLALIAMLAAHGAGYWCRFHMNDPRRGDMLFFLATTLYGCIMLIVLDHYYVHTAYWSVMLSWGLFAWAAGTLPLAWVLGSIPLLLFADILGIIWIITHIRITGDAGITVLFVAQSLCLLRLAYTNGSRTLLTVTLVSLLVWWCMLGVAEGLARGVFWIAAAGPLLILTGLRHEENHPFAGLYKQMGIVVCGLLIPFLAMPSMSRALMESSFKLNEWLLMGMVLGIVILYVPTGRRFDYARDWPAIAALSAVTAVPAVLNILSYGQGFVAVTSGLLTAVLNAAAIGAVVWIITQGAMTDCGGTIALGIVYFLAWSFLLLLDLAGDWTRAAVMFALAAAAILLLVRSYSRTQVQLHETVPSENA